MGNIIIENLTYKYESSDLEIFSNVNLNISTDWKLGLIGKVALVKQL